jgi:hypothetical protein
VAVDRSGEFSYLTTSISNQPPPPNEAIDPGRHLADDYVAGSRVSQLYIPRVGE